MARDPKIKSNRSTNPTPYRRGRRASDNKNNRISTWTEKVDSASHLSAEDRAAIARRPPTLSFQPMPGGANRKVPTESTLTQFDLGTGLFELVTRPGGEVRIGAVSFCRVLKLSHAQFKGIWALAYNTVGDGSGFAFDRPSPGLIHPRATVSALIAFQILKLQRNGVLDLDVDGSQLVIERAATMMREWPNLSARIGKVGRLSHRPAWINEPFDNSAGS